MTNESEEEGLASSKSIAIPLFIIGNKFDLLDSDHHDSKITVIEKYLEELFDKDPKMKFIFVSEKTDISQFNEIDRFINNCLSGNEAELFYYDPSRELYPYDTYKKFTMSIGEDLKIFFTNMKIRFNRFCKSRKREELII